MPKTHSIDARTRIVSASAHLAVLFLLITLIAPTFAQDADRFARWEPAIRAFEAGDAKASPPKHAALFVGSSSIRGWNLPEYFRDRPVINRGFGGSQIADSVHFASRIIVPHEPNTVVLYAGDNDIAAGKSPQTVRDDFKAFVRTVHESLPEARIVFIAIKPSLRRWGLVEKMREANALIRTVIDADDRLRFIDIDGPMLGPDGKPRSELFVRDGLHLSHAGYRLWTSLVEPHLRSDATSKTGQLCVATCQFSVSGDIAANAEWIRSQMREAKQRGADIAHFSEVALSGYAGVDHMNLDHFDWDAQHIEMESILSLARSLRMWVVLGAGHRLTGAHKPHNSLYVINDDGVIIDRYDKRFCTGGDLRHYSPGDHFVTFEVNDVRCGLLICYDIRFPELYRQYHKLGARLLFHSFYNARQKPGSIHPKIMPPTAQARAATNNLFLSVNNSCAPNSWESLFVTPDGLIQERLVLDEPGVMINLVDTGKRYYDASRAYRLDSINGKWNSGQTVNDPRSKDRRAY